MVRSRILRARSLEPMNVWLPWKRYRLRHCNVTIIGCSNFASKNDMLTMLITNVRFEFYLRFDSRNYNSLSYSSEGDQLNVRLSYILGISIFMSWGYWVVTFLSARQDIFCDFGQFYFVVPLVRACLTQKSVL